MWSTIASQLAAPAACSLIAYLTKVTVKPPMSRMFLLASFASQLHIPIVGLHAGTMLYLYRCGFFDSDFAPLPLSLAVAAVTAASYIVIARDFAEGFFLERPVPQFPVSRDERKEIRRAHAREGHPLSQWINRALLMLFPPILRLAVRFFNTKDRHIRYTDPNSHVELHLDVVVARSHKPTSRRPVILYVHGGAWVVGSKDGNGIFPVNFMASSGWVCVTIDYRLSKLKGVGPVWPDHIVDVKTAICWVKENIAKYGGDPSVIVVAGGSAGGHLASLAALTPNLAMFQPGFEHKDTTVQGCISMYGVMDFTDHHGQWRQHEEVHGTRKKGSDEHAFLIKFLEALILKKNFASERDVFVHASPLHHAMQRGSRVPFFLAHGTRDTIVPMDDARLLRDVLGRHMVTHFEVKGGHHAFDTFPSPRAFVALDAVEEWLCDFEHIYWPSRGASSRTGKDSR